ncbi:uncharacterized [Tachysurus ichikawai]
MEDESERDRRHGRFERFMQTIKNSHQLTFQGLQSLFRRDGRLCQITRLASLQARALARLLSTSLNAPPIIP